MKWFGVLPAMTTPFDSETRRSITASWRNMRRGSWAIGCAGLVMLGSLGEGATLEHDEKIAILKTAVSVAGSKPVIAAISSLSTSGAVALAKDAEQAGLLRPDGAAAVCILVRLARDEGNTSAP
jgi:dihydrodipicolinate synthase/N-acetylneuraminate lyase